MNDIIYQEVASFSVVKQQHTHSLILSLILQYSIQFDKIKRNLYYIIKIQQMANFSSLFPSCYTFC